MVLRIEVSAQGEALGSEVAEHTTTRYFAHAAQENFSRCRFKPARENGVPVQGHGVVRLVFDDHPHAPNRAECPAPFSRATPPSDGPMVATKLRIRFLQTGHVASVDVLEPSGAPALDDAAVKAYLQCRFDPDAGGQPTFQEEWVTTINWSK